MSTDKRKKQLDALNKNNNSNAQNIIEEPRWWEAQNLPWQLVQELRRRRNDVNIGQSYPTNVNFDFFNKHGDYKGPLTPWVRAFSNSTGQIGNNSVPASKYLNKNNESKVYNGFLLEGGHGFNNAYGYKRNGSGLQRDKAIIGFEADGTPHYIDEKYRNLYNYNVGLDENYTQRSEVPNVLPPPGIKSIEVKTAKDMLSFATINWECYSLAQLEYMTPFWLSPKINVFLEFGWNLFNINSLIDLNDLTECYKLVTNPHTAIDRWYDSYGNYGLITGVITKYNFNTSNGILYNCTTEITSRQALYSGFRVDNPTTTYFIDKSTNKVNTIEHLTLKKFLKEHLSAATAKKVLEDEENYIQYLLSKNVNFGFEAQQPVNLPNMLNTDGSMDLAKYKEYEPTIPKYKKFYNGSPEDRIFTARVKEIYKKSANFKPKTTTAKPGSYSYGAAFSNVNTTNTVYDVPKEESINYGFVPERAGGGAFEQIPRSLPVISDLDKDTDFDRFSTNAFDKVWYQLDFVFEIFNLFCEENYSGINKIDISNTIIAAHPNLISCDENVLIPNPVSPKINLGRKPSANGKAEGYLDSNDANIETNPFINQWSFDNWYKKDENDPLYNAAQAQLNTFKTFRIPRDNLDIIINRIFYDRRRAASAVKKVDKWDASFPFKSDVTVKHADGGERVYPKYYNGYLKHIYISSKILKNLGEASDINTLQDLVRSILSTINQSVDNFWNLDVVQSDDGGLSIVDKNLGFNSQNQLYMFDLGNSNSFVKSYDLQVNMTNEQTVQTIYGAGQNADFTVNDIKSRISEIQDSNESKQIKIEKISQLKTGLPAIVYNDRFEQLDLQETFNRAINEIPEDDVNFQERKQDGNPSNGKSSPKGPFKDQNDDIRKLQIKNDSSSDPQGPLIMRLRRIDSRQSFNERGELIDSSGKVDLSNEFYLNWVYLNLPSYMKDKLREMLDDGDLKNNIAKYGGPADNFTLNLTLDGIFGLRMFQHFAVTNLPKPYVPGNVIFQISEVNHSLNAGKWETNITALLRCTGNKQYNYIMI